MAAGAMAARSISSGDGRPVTLLASRETSVAVERVETWAGAAGGC
jgi:hypothetical protein